MKINTVKCKQIKNGVYNLKNGGEIVAANRRYTLPQNSIVIPSDNIVLLKTYKGDYAWQYIANQDMWRVWQISSDNINDAIDSVKTKPFDMTVIKIEGNKALMRISEINAGNKKCKTEYRFYTSFFKDLIRKER